MQNNNYSFKTSFTFIDLFAGIGGFHLALNSLGGKCVFISEIDKYARITYQNNYNTKNVNFNYDIRDITIDDIPDHDILCAGFPCQPFSQAGKKQGFSDNNKSERGNLFFCIADILEHKRPKAFILENVKYLINHDNKNTLNLILKTLNNLNYYVEYKVLKASDYNSPQHRPRVYFVGFDKNTINTKNKFTFPIPLKLTITMSDIFQGECNKTIGFTLRVGGRGSKITDRRNWEFYYVNGNITRIGIQQAKLMMGFPKSFTFPVSEAQAMKQLGNSVCINVIQALAEQVIKYIKVNNMSSKNKQNKGEISESYVFFKILYDRIIHFAEVNGYKSQDTIKIYKINLPNKFFYIENNNISNDYIKLPISKIINSQELEQIVNIIKNKQSTFNLDIIESKKKYLNLTDTNFKSDSTQKQDIVVSFIYNNMNYPQIPISIKSHLGNSPSILNASSATNFIFKVENIDNDKIQNIINNTQNIKDGRLKINIKQRIYQLIQAQAKLSFLKCENSTYQENLTRIDSKMPEILAEILLKYYSKEFSKFSQLQISQQKKIRIKDYIKSTLLGIFPTKLWDGNLSANGIFLVDKQGQIVLFHIIKDNILKDYFYNKAYLDTPSLTRHRFGHIFIENNINLIKLNLLIRLGI